MVTRSAERSRSSCSTGASARAASSSTRHPTEGVRVLSPFQIKSLFPILKSPANRHKAVGFTPEEFHHAFRQHAHRRGLANVYGRYHIPTRENWVWAYGLMADFKPGHQETWVNYKNESRAPLLPWAEARTTMPPSVNKSNAKHYKGNTVTE
jgi:hypothetical protein